MYAIPVARNRASRKLIFNAEGNESAELIESLNWAATSLGAIERWPKSLHLTLGIVLNSHFPMFLFWGADFVCFYNNAARLKNGDRHPFAMGKKGIEVWPDLWHVIQPRLTHVLETGEGTWNEDQCIPIVRNGLEQDIYSTFSYSPVYDERGHRVGVLVTGIESTEKMQTLKRLEESEKKFRSLIMQAPVGIAILKGRDFTFEIANEVYLDITGKTRKIIGQSLAKVIPELAEQGYSELLTKVLLTGISYHGKEFPIRLMRHEKEECRYVNFVYEPMKEADGTIPRIMVIVIDVTDQVVARFRSEEMHRELRKLADAMPHLVWMANPEGVVTYMNNRIAEFSGATQTRDGNWRWNGMVHPEDVSTAVENWNTAIRNATFYESEHRLNMLDGTYKWHLCRAYPHKNEKREVIKWFGTATDIDGQKRLSEQLELRVQERTRELQKSNNELAQFAYIASHDLQEPLRKIMTFIDLLNKNLGAIDERSKDYLQKIGNSSERMSILIRDILNFSRLSSQENMFTKVDLNDVLKTVINDFELVIQQKEATIDTVTLPVLEAIPLQVGQLFHNLLSNSLKFVDENRKPVIQITCKKLTPREILRYPDLNPSLAYYNLQIKDNGIGFDQKFAEHVFTIFQRLNTRQSFSGTGIGLALCKKIMANHHGHITATSAENQGATFNVILPEHQIR